MKKGVEQVIALMKLTVKRFLGLSYEDQVEVLETLKTDYEVVRDLIRDRNDFRRGYFILLKQLEEVGIEPKYSYYNIRENYKKRGS